jgi:hypothetical protein
MRNIIYTSLILAGILLSCPASFAQSKFALSATAAPFYSHNKSWGKFLFPAEDGSGTFVDQDWQAESSATGFSAGLNGRYSFSPNWSASAGFWYNLSIPADAGLSGRSHNFAIPLAVNLQTSDKKLSPYFSAGALWNFTTTSRLQVPDFGTIVVKSDNSYPKVAPTVAAGAIYHFAPKLSLVAQPNLTWFFPPANIKSRSYRLGLQMQLMWML